MNPVTSSTGEIANEATDNLKILEPVTYSINSVKKFINAIENESWSKLRLSLGDGSLVNTLVKGPKSYAGMTLLQIASILSSEEAVKILINEYHADINVKNKDGIQLIQWACLHHLGTLVGILLDAGANLNATIQKDLFLESYKGQVKHPKRLWHDQFGDEVTIPEFAVLYDDFSSIAKCLVERNIDLNLKNPMGGNKTLLMYAIESDTVVGDPLLKMYKDLGLLNARDDDGFSAAHYLLHPKIYGNFRYDMTQFEKELGLGFNMRYLLHAGADVYATINGDPDTLLINMASYRSSFEILKELLPYYNYTTESKALYYATLPVGDLKTSFRVNDYYDGDFPTEHVEYLQRQRKKCVELIVEDLINRCALGLPVPRREKEIMDELFATDPEIRDKVENFIIAFFERMSICS